MALNGLEGQRFSHAPQPMQLSSATTGMSTESSLEGSLRTIMMAPTGQWRAQLPQVTPSLSITQRSRSIVAVPMCQGVDEGPERALEKKENRKVLESLIADLPPELRRVLELDQKGYAFVDIAKIEGVPKDIIERRYRSAVRAIQDMLF